MSQSSVRPTTSTELLEAVIKEEASTSLDPMAVKVPDEDPTTASLLGALKGVQEKRPHQNVGLVDRFRSIPQKADALLHREPCMRSSLLYGISSGAVIGILKYYRRPNVITASNWAMGAFALISAINWRIEQFDRGKAFTKVVKESADIDDLRTNLEKVELFDAGDSDN